MRKYVTELPIESYRHRLTRESQDTVATQRAKFDSSLSTVARPTSPTCRPVTTDNTPQVRRETHGTTTLQRRRHVRSHHRRQVPCPPKTRDTHDCTHCITRHAAPSPPSRTAVTIVHVAHSITRTDTDHMAAPTLITSHVPH